MNLFENFLNNTVYQYFPKHLYEADEQYCASNEFKEHLRLRRDTWNLSHEPLRKFSKEIRFSLNLNQSMVNEGVHGGSSHVIQFMLESNNDYCKVLVVYISFMIPYYHIVILTYDRQAKSTASNYKIDSELGQIMHEKMKDIFEFHMFPVNYVNYRFPDLIVYDGFTALNAFFTDYYRINQDFLISKDKAI